MLKYDRDRRSQDRQPHYHQPPPLPLATPYRGYSHLALARCLCLCAACALVMTVAMAAASTVDWWWLWQYRYLKCAHDLMSLCVCTRMRVRCRFYDNRAWGAVLHEANAEIALEWGGWLFVSFSSIIIIICIECADVQRVTKRRTPLAECKSRLMPCSKALWPNYFP